MIFFIKNITTINYLKIIVSLHQNRDTRSHLHRKLGSLGQYVGKLYTTKAG